MPELDESDEQETAVETPETETEEPVEDSPEGEEPAEEPEEAAEEPAPSRRENRVQALARRTREAEDRALRAETERDALKNTRSAPQTNPEESRRVRDEKLALMDPQERRDFLRDEEMKELKQSMALSRFQTQDMMDRTGFEAEIKGTALEKMKGEVERLYADALKAGNFVPRLSLLDYVIGKQAREKLKQPAGKAIVAAKKAAADRVDSVKTKPMSGKSDTKAGKSDDDADALFERIKSREARGDTR